jgi:hypothetical protein
VDMLFDFAGYFTAMFIVGVVRKWGWRVSGV